MPNSSTWTSSRVADACPSRKSASMRHMLLRPAGRALALAVALALAAFPAAAADMNKVIRHVFPAGEEGFDPAAAHDLYSGTVEQVIFETLLTYDYLARPAKLVPLTAEAMPQVTDDGQTYTFRIRKGIHFTPDPAFKGAKRELVADDYVYSLKRLMDPKMRSPWTWLLDGKIVGLDEAAAQAKKSGKFDYDAKVAGLEAVDRYTLRIRLKQPDYNLSYVLAHEPTGAVAREVVAAYADEGGRVMSNPVGTGPYKLAKWIRSSKIFLEANPDYRGFVWDFKPGADRRGRAARGRDEGQEDAAGRPDRDQHHGGGPVAAARVPERRARPHEPRGAARAEGAERRHADARDAEEGRQALALRRPRDHLPLLEPAGPRRRRPHEGEDRAAPCDGDGVPGRRGHQGHPQRPGGRGAVPDPAGRRRPRPELPVEHQVRPGRRQRAARQVSATRRAPTAFARCPTASRS